MIEKTKDLAVELVPGSEVVYGAYWVFPGAFLSSQKTEIRET
jgi:hypothetical protein